LSIFLSFNFRTVGNGSSALNNLKDSSGKMAGQHKEWQRVVQKCGGKSPKESYKKKLYSGLSLQCVCSSPIYKSSNKS